MKKLDYIVVGKGFAGAFFTFELIKHKHSFIVIDNAKKSASKISAGVFNPIVLKRFNPIWMAQYQMQLLNDKLEEMQLFFQTQLLQRNTVNRIFHDKSEKDTWIAKSSDTNLSDYLDPIIQPQPEYIKAPYGLGEVRHTGRIDVKAFFNSLKNYLENNNSYLEEKFDYANLKTSKGLFHYMGYEAKYIVFCEGIGVNNNPYFQYLPISSNKGECIHVEAEDIPERKIYKKRHFYFQLENNKFYVGGTNNHHDFTEINTAEIQDELLSEVRGITSSKLKVCAHYNAFRPISKDRRPIVGSHPDNSNMLIINGMGTRATLLAPYSAQQLYNLVESNVALDSTIDCQRFAHLYKS